MANAPYDKARVQLLTAGLDWRTITLTLSAWGGIPSFDPTDDMISDITARGFTELGISQPITAQAVTANGTAQTNTVVIPAVPIGPSVTWFTMSWSQTIHAQSQPILFIDTADDLPFVPNGLDLVIQPDWLQNRGWWRP
jgi:hypothetical protein